MKNGTIPGTPGIEKPVDDKLVRENTPWPKCELKRAGLSAFGLVVQMHMPFLKNIKEIVVPIYEEMLLVHQQEYEQQQ